VHEEWTDQLSDYLDGELPDAERRAVDAHLKRCAACAAVLNDLKRIVARAQGVAGAPRPPASDLWKGVAARIEAAPHGEAGAQDEEGTTGRRVARFTPRPTRRIAFTMPQLAAAAVLIAAVSGGIVWTAVSRPDGVRSATAAAPDAAAPPTAEQNDAAAPPLDAAADHVVPVGLADAQYDAAVLDLETALKQGRGRLDASTIAIVEHNLQIIDQAIDQARDALAADPANTYLSGHLVEARRRKLDLLRRAAALTTESD
jgi:anti-sigma factor RsiW